MKAAGAEEGIFRCFYFRPHETRQHSLLMGLEVSSAASCNEGGVRRVMLKLAIPGVQTEAFREAATRGKCVRSRGSDKPGYPFVLLLSVVAPSMRRITLSSRFVPLGHPPCRSSPPLSTPFAAPRALASPLQRPRRENALVTLRQWSTPRSGTRDAVSPWGGTG